MCRGAHCVTVRVRVTRKGKARHHLIGSESDCVGERRDSVVLGFKICRGPELEIVWDGVTQAQTLSDEQLAVRYAFADVAKRGDWAAVFELLRQDGDLINRCRPGGAAQFSALHKAAFSGASKKIVQRLIDFGAWRTLQNARGERPIDVATRCGNKHLVGILTPALKHHVPAGVLLKIQNFFHGVIAIEGGRLIEEHALRLPELESLLELDMPKMWFPVPGMYGGFSFQLVNFGVEAKLVSESWCRVVEGSGMRYEITSEGSILVEKGFA